MASGGRRSGRGWTVLAVMAVLWFLGKQLRAREVRLLALSALSTPALLEGLS